MSELEIKKFQEDLLNIVYDKLTKQSYEDSQNPNESNLKLKDGELVVDGPKGETK